MLQVFWNATEHTGPKYLESGFCTPLHGLLPEACSMLDSPKGTLSVNAELASEEKK